ncbi:MAG: acyltransferase [Rubrobacter sp.]|nr:acyltransferase [Rubrobacter sp.]
MSASGLLSRLLGRDADEDDSRPYSAEEIETRGSWKKKEPEEVRQLRALSIQRSTGTIASLPPTVSQGHAETSVELTHEKPAREGKQTSDLDTRNVVIDALRGLAILSVVGTHIAGQWKYTPTDFGGSLPQLTLPFLNVDAIDLVFLGTLGRPALSTLGVYLFFLLSGYLLLGLEDERKRRGTYSVRSYALRRALRILPAYYVAIAIVVVIASLIFSSAISHEYMVKWGVLHLLFLYAILEPVNGAVLHTYWYLNVEMFNYLLLPFVVALLPRLRQRLALSGLLFVLSLGVQVYIGQNGLRSVEALEAGALNLWFLSELPVVMFLFMVGGLLRMTIERLGNQKQSRWLPLVSSVLLLASLSLYALQPLFVANPFIEEILGNGQIAVIAFFASAVLGAPLLSKLLRWRLLASIGLISYSMYLLNDIIYAVAGAAGVLDLVRDWAVSGGSSLTMWIAFFAYMVGLLEVCIIVSHLSYRYVERPFLRSKTYLTAAPSTADCAKANCWS